MLLKKISRLLLRRPYFKGQHRLFYILFKKGYLTNNETSIVKPLQGNFNIQCDTNTWIGAQIVYLGEYEDYIKDTFKKYISKNDTVLDIGANIGFHTLYFSELVGDTGKVIAFEPVPSTFNQLIKNISLNRYHNITPLNIALSNRNEDLFIHVNDADNNPGANNLFNLGDTKIECKKGDDIINENKIDFIKIDVEGYELYALEGLQRTIEKQKPKIVFEFDKNYQLKTHTNPIAIFDFLKQFNYTFFEIKRNKITEINQFKNLISTDILALPN